MSNSFGKIFKISTYGESHGLAIGVIIDGCPSGISISSEEIQKELDRRKPGQSKITTQRKEDDKIANFCKKEKIFTQTGIKIKELELFLISMPQKVKPII